MLLAGSVLLALLGGVALALNLLMSEGVGWSRSLAGLLSALWGTGWLFAFFGFCWQVRSHVTSVNRYEGHEVLHLSLEFSGFLVTFAAFLVMITSVVLFVPSPKRLWWFLGWGVFFAVTFFVFLVCQPWSSSLREKI